MFMNKRKIKKKRKEGWFWWHEEEGDPWLRKCEQVDNETFVQ